ncbi:MAG: transposase domain-containing protein [Oligosphaeraceae bacterium]
MAILVGLAATCRENGVDVEEWLSDVLPRLDTHPAARIGELLPHEWWTRRDAPAEPAD